MLKGCAQTLASIVKELLHDGACLAAARMRDYECNRGHEPKSSKLVKHRMNYYFEGSRHTVHHGVLQVLVEEAQKQNHRNEHQ